MHFPGWQAAVPVNNRLASESWNWEGGSGAGQRRQDALGTQARSALP